MPQLSPGGTVGPYEIVSLLGKGGMGEVYLARDPRLDRKVALKILPRAVAFDDERLRRFTQEARAASALNHPNILTIYDIGEADGLPYMAAEYVDGETLRDRLRASRLSLREALDIATQIAAGVAAAHDAGIVHRDIKPENIMLRRDGYVKILDFGLAKLTERAAAAGDTQALTQAYETRAGVVMGTAAYMSPEQARGRPVDARSDVFSLGVVLYEMVANRPPFEGETPSHLIVAILEKHPQPLAAFTNDAPAELERIVAKSLAKDPEERYQTTKDLNVDLKQLRRTLEFDTRATPSSGYPLPTARHATSSNPSMPTPPPLPPVESAPQADTGLHGDFEGFRRWFTGIPKKRRRRLVLIAIVLIVGLRGLTSDRSGGSASTPKHTFDSFGVRRLTTTGKVSDAVISPDGKYIAHVQNDAGKRSLWMRQTDTASNVQILAPKETFYSWLTFSPDGNYLYFMSAERAQAPVIYRMPTLGGEPKAILSGASSGIAISRDGEKIAYLKRSAPTAPRELLVSNLDGTGVRSVWVESDKTFARNFAWSPDNVRLALSLTNLEDGVAGELWVVNSKSGRAKKAAKHSWTFVGSVGFLNEDHVVLLASEQFMVLNNQIWHVDLDSGEARRLTNDTNHYQALSVAASTDRVMVVQSQARASLAVASAPRLDQIEPLTPLSAAADGLLGVVWTRDGRVVYQSRSSGMDELWSINAENGAPVQLTSDTRLTFNPSLSPDGQAVYQMSVRSGVPLIWRTKLDGTEPAQITRRVSSDTIPSVSPDGKYLLIPSLSPDKPGLFRLDLSSGSEQKISDAYCTFPEYSRDGTSIACWQPPSPTQPLSRVLVLDTDGRETRSLSIERPGVFSLRWLPDSSGFNFLAAENGITQLFAQPVAGGAPRQLTAFKDDLATFRYAWSPDGQKIVYSRGDFMQDVVLLDGKSHH